MEAWTCSLCRTATLRRRPGPGGANRRQPTWPLAARKQPRAYQGTAKQLLRFTRPGFRRGTAVRIIRRTAVYGPVRTVVWEGRSREAPPYPDFGDGLEERISMTGKRNSVVQPGPSLSADRIFIRFAQRAGFSRKRCRPCRLQYLRLNNVRVSVRATRLTFLRCAPG